MQERKIIYLEFYSPWMLGGYSQKTIGADNDLFQAVAFVINETDTVLNLALGESNGNYLHEMRIPKACIKPGSLIELPRPLKCEDLGNHEKN